MTRYEKALVLLLRASAVVLVSAAFPVAMPFEWMARTHSALGMGALPNEPIVHYLTRSVSALYVLHGALLAFVAQDVRRYLPLVRFLGFMNLVLGAALLAIDLASGMPAFWTLVEGPLVAALGVLTLWLAGGASRAP